MLVPAPLADYIAHMKRWIPFTKSPARINVVRLSGMIATGNRGTLNDQAVSQTLSKAFARGKPKAVALAINSPGGSPAQSALVADRIRRLADKHEVPVYAFVEDVAASGGYYIASAADAIWVTPSSIVGSIGVISASFGFHEFLARQGIERRVHTAGNSKSMLDPFLPENREDVRRLTVLQEEVHRVFVEHVQMRRAGKLNTGMDLFNGDVWVGRQAIETGLIDAVGYLEPVLKDRFGEDAKFQIFGPKRPVIGRLGLTLAQDALIGVEERALWARYGL